ncbi:MAG: c-type cytochrome [Actinobacteria bacterium]|nr:c-type cytochrome [Actinomycetota bacterium]
MITVGAVLAVAALLWSPASIVPAPAATEAATSPGRDIFEAHCAMCHGADAAGMMGMHPSLRGAVERLTRAGVEVTVRNGRDTNPPMPAFDDRLTDRQIDDVIAYIASLPTGPRNFGPSMPMMRAGDVDDQTTRGRGMMDGGMMGGFAVLWIILIVALIALAVAAVAWLVRNMGGSGRAGDPRGDSPHARAELDRRYAAGELSRDEYLQRREDLNL